MLPGPAGPRGHSRCGLHLPSQPEAAWAPPVTQAEAAPPPAPPRSSRRSAGESLYLRVSQPQNGAEGGKPAPPRPTAPRPERAAETPPVGHSPETRLSGASSVTAPGASREKRRGEAGPAPLGTSGRGEAAARRRRTETVRESPRRPRQGSASSGGLGREAAGEKGGPTRSEVTREASRDGGRCRTRSAGPPAAAARPGRRNPSRQARDWLFAAVSQPRMLPRLVAEREDSSFPLKSPSF